MDLGRVQRELLVARQALVEGRAELQLLVALDSAAELELAGALEAVVAKVAPREVPESEAVALALGQRADLQIVRAELALAKAEAAAARREAWPSPAVGVGYEREGGEQVVQGLIALDLPVLDRNLAQQGATAARVLQAQVALDAAERRARVELTAARKRHQTARDAVALYQNGINQAAQTAVALVQEGYHAGKLDLFQLLLIQRSALEARLGYIDALAELGGAAAELNLAMGQGD